MLLANDCQAPNFICHTAGVSHEQASATLELAKKMLADRTSDRPLTV
ncbi:hypothetical protein [Coleofasciculus sp. FACHB-1120]|nr:hypothetical protein [Coleofasciculus sp. FACHB-1120]MBD2741577.1 hypothetical protein [Coleofasciculus sp. FACHB-1120]